jgi:hypothetical protein
VVSGSGFGKRVLFQVKESDGRVILVMKKKASASGNLKIGPLVVWSGKCSF